MRDPRELAATVPALLRHTDVGLFGERVWIADVVLTDPQHRSVVVRVIYVVDDGDAETFDFEVDDFWEFESTEDVIDQLKIDLLEHIATEGLPGGGP